jgi:hypothetical protein
MFAAGILMSDRIRSGKGQRSSRIEAAQPSEHHCVEDPRRSEIG